MHSALTQTLDWAAAAQRHLLQPSPLLGLPWMDVLGTPRLAIALDQVFRAANPLGRPSFVAELVTMLTLVFAGDVLLPLLWPGLPPSILLTSATPYLLFGITHALVTKTALKRVVPKEAGLKWEAVAAVFDGLTRAIVVCTFFTDALLRHPALAANRFALVLLAWTGVYGGALVVGAGGMWKREWGWGTPAELKKGGWRTVDFWVPPVFSLLYQHLAHPVPSSFLSTLHSHLSFASALLLPPSLHKPAHHLLARTVGEHRLRWSADEARALVGVLLALLFVARAVGNFGGQLRVGRRAGGEKQGQATGGASVRKIKTQ